MVPGIVVAIELQGPFPFVPRWILWEDGSPEAGVQFTVSVLDCTFEYVGVPGVPGRPPPPPPPPPPATMVEIPVETSPNVFTVIVEIEPSEIS